MKYITLLQNEELKLSAVNYILGSVFLGSINFEEVSLLRLSGRLDVK